MEEMEIQISKCKDTTPGPENIATSMVKQFF